MAPACDSRSVLSRIEMSDHSDKHNANFFQVLIADQVAILFALSALHVVKCNARLIDVLDLSFKLK